MNTSEKTEIFHAAHKLAKTARAQFATYREAFAAALRTVWANFKFTAKLEAAGCTEWEKYGYHRYYMTEDALRTLAGLTPMSNGKWEAADGRVITSGAFKAIVGRGFFDVETRTLDVSKVWGVNLWDAKEIIMEAMGL